MFFYIVYCSVFAMSKFCLSSAPSSKVPRRLLSNSVRSLWSPASAVCQMSPICSPTRGDNLLDVVAADASLVVSDVDVIDAGLASDHRLVTVKLGLHPPARSAVPVRYRRIANIDVDDFQAALRRSSLFTHPSPTAEGFACQLVDVVTAERDAIAP